MTTKEPEKPALSPLKSGGHKINNKGLGLEIPVHYFADQTGEINIGPFVSRIVFTTTVVGQSNQHKAVAAVSIPTNSLVGLASTILTLLSKEEVKATLKSDYQRFSSSLDDIQITFPPSVSE